MGRILNVNFNGMRKAKTLPLYQYDYGQILKIGNLSLPMAYEVHFANSETGESTTSIGNADGVTIPDIYLRNGSPVYAWLFLHDTESDGETEYRIEIPVIKRPRPTDIEPTPVQQDVITQAIAALNVAVEQTESDVETTGAYADSAATSAANAYQSEMNAAQSETNAAESSVSANQSAVRSEESSVSSAQSAESSEQSSISARISADRAEQAATNAGYLFVDMVNGRLVYTRTDAVDVDFELSDGRLIMEVI